MANVAITGASGQLGQSIRALCDNYASSVNFYFTDKEELDISKADSIRKYLRQYSCTALINCAAYTAVDKAETEQEAAYLINRDAAGILANVCRELSVKLLHISTDFVFDGKKNTPYREDDATAPLSVYGKSKAEGELLALQNNPEVMIIRTGWLYSQYGNNFLKTILRLCQEREQINVVFDQVGTPTYAVDLATVILKIITGNKWIPGIYHFSNEGVSSWYDFAVNIAQLSGSRCRVLPIETSQYPTPAQRPPYSVLNKQKIRSVYEISISHWQESLARCMQHI
ncbi:MAG: dTDP-4-dehydrorhamnose reductase [Chitinophagales bacterium]|nr:dTDP-4-dehydrorhamnose reductase [Chitinophagales bacterium]MDW8419125.1 dTDP-4-dehydrorhamnose reductase [Chitinophagales bacterium]